MRKTGYTLTSSGFVMSCIHWILKVSKLWLTMHRRQRNTRLEQSRNLSVSLRPEFAQAL